MALGVPSVCKTVVSGVMGREPSIIKPGLVAPYPSLAASQTPGSGLTGLHQVPCKLLSYLS